MENEKRANLKLALSWIFGLIFSFFGFIGIITLDFAPGIIMALMGVVLLPPASKFLENKYKFKPSAKQKAIFLVVGFFIFGSVSKSPNPEQKKPADIIEQKQVVAEQAIKENATVENESVVQSEILEQKTEGKKLYAVVKVVDGDTLAVNVDGKEEVLRLIGINTPETVDPRKPVECFGVEASAKAKAILTGRQVALEADPTQGELDKYNRLLRYVYLEDGTNFNKLMIEEGYAYEYTYNTPYKYQADFKEAQKKAAAEKTGLWADDACSGKLIKPIENAQTQTTSTVAPKIEVIEQPKASTNIAVGSCAGKRTCGQMANCQEAYFYLNNCGVGGLDRDKDGIPCETICN